MPSPLRSQSSDQTHWFANEVHPHESALRAYVKNQFPKIGDVDDVVQESFLRIWSAQAKNPIMSAKAFLFRIARHAAIDLTRRSKASPINGVRDLDEMDVIEDGPGVVDIVSMAEKTRLLAKAIDALPARCREVVVLRKLKGVPQAQVAIFLGISEKTVETQLSRGLKRCEDFLRKRGVHHYYTNESR
jgi:RNA polymerase sigma factor (sigma-70 family)|uniref:RNA polymerase sigma factor n=1 Tax=Cephaloticoccus sp. TaxID=1985742 RepID=UPI00404A59AE